MNLDFYKSKFEREQRRRIELDNAMNLPILVSTLIMGLNSFILKEHTFNKEWNSIDWMVVIFLSLSFILILISSYYIFLSTNNLFKKNKLFQGIDYPNFALMREYRKLEVDNNNCNIENKVDIENVIIEKIIKYADESTLINIERAHNLSESRKFLIINFMIVIINIAFVTTINLLQ